MFSFEGPDRRKEEDRVRNEGRLPPGQSLTIEISRFALWSRAKLQRGHLGFPRLGRSGGGKTLDMG